MKLSLPVINTTAGASTTGAAAGVIITGLLNSWSWYAHQSSAFQTAATVVVTAVLAYLGAWLKVVSTPGQKTSMELTSSPFPTMQAVKEEVKPPAVV